MTLPPLTFSSRGNLRRRVIPLTTEESRDVADRPQLLVCVICECGRLKRIQAPRAQEGGLLCRLPGRGAALEASRQL